MKRRILIALAVTVLSLTISCQNASVRETGSPSAVTASSDAPLMQSVFNPSEEAALSVSTPTVTSDSGFVEGPAASQPGSDGGSIIVSNPRAPSSDPSSQPSTSTSDSGNSTSPTPSTGSTTDNSTTVAQNNTPSTPTDSGNITPPPSPVSTPPSPTSDGSTAGSAGNSGNELSGTVPADSAANLADNGAANSGNPPPSPADSSSAGGANGGTANSTTNPSDAGTIVADNQNPAPGTNSSQNPPPSPSLPTSSPESNSEGTVGDGASVPGDDVVDILDPEPSNGHAGHGVCQGGHHNGGHSHVCQHYHGCGIAQHEVRVKLNRLCPASATSQLVFEKAAHPILALEASLERPQAMNYLATPAPIRYHSQPAYQPIGHIDLKATDLFGPRFHEVSLDFIAAQISKHCRSEGAKQNMWIRAFVCNDTNNDGRCSDERMENQLALHNPTHKASEFPSALVLEVRSQRNSCQSYRPSPLVIDLGGKGVHLSSCHKGRSLQYADGKHRAKQSWFTDSNSAMVIYRRGGNDCHSGGEIIGLRSDAYQKLRSIDDDHNGKVDKHDKEWKSLQLWIDRNGNGEAESNELSSMEENGVENISVEPVSVYETDQHGNATYARCQVEVKRQGQRETRIGSSICFAHE